MKCPKCGSENVNTQAVAVTKNAHHGIIWWLCIGWWWWFIKWFVFTIPALIVSIFAPNRIKTKVKTYCSCQNCGHTWKR